MSFRTNALLAGFTAIAVGLVACGDDDEAPIAAASGGSAGAKAGAAGAAGAKAGSAGSTSGGTGGVAGTTSGGSAGTTSGGSAGTTSGGSAGTTAGGSAGTTAGGSAGTTAGGSAGTTAGGSAGSTAGAAGSSAGAAGSAGATAGAGGAAGSGLAGAAGATAGGAAGAAGSTAGGAAGAGGSEPIPNFAAIALGNNGAIYRFDTNNPAGAATGTATDGGLLGGTPLALIGIDYRLSDGLLYGATDTTLFQLTNAALPANNLTGGAAKTFDPNLAGGGQGFDFNPAANITVDGSGNPLRIVGYNDASNARYNPTNGKRIAPDAKLTYAVFSPGDPQIAASAYTNNYQGTTSTKLYALEGRTDTLVEQDPPNDGVLKNVAPLGVDVADLAGFDIVSVVGADTVVKNYGFAVVGDGFYTVRLTAGTEPALTLVGRIPGATQLRGLAIALQPK